VWHLHCTIGVEGFRVRKEDLPMSDEFTDDSTSVYLIGGGIASAQTAVYSLLRLDRTPPPVSRGQDKLRVLLQAVETLHDRQRA
jgi:myosin-crossreactive antigen